MQGSYYLYCMDWSVDATLACAGDGGWAQLSNGTAVVAELEVSAPPSLPPSPLPPSGLWKNAAVAPARGSVGACCCLPQPHTGAGGEAF